LFSWLFISVVKEDVSTFQPNIALDRHPVDDVLSFFFLTAQSFFGTLPEMEA